MGNLLTSNEQAQLGYLAKQDTLDGQRARALLAIDNGRTQKDAAAGANLSTGQVSYILKKFREQGMDAFPDAPVAPLDEAAAQDERLSKLITDLDELVADLKDNVPSGGEAAYSPLRLVNLIRENVGQLAPDMQLGILESFEGMTKEDLMDLETWKGMAYMLNYSARFQANQLKDRMNTQLPDPLKPDTILGLIKQNLERFTPDLAKELAQNLQGASREDLMDPDTWKGMWYMVNYSLQFQVEQMKQRLAGNAPDDEV